jgi:hypothetical protein
VTFGRAGDGLLLRYICYGIGPWLHGTPVGNMAPAGSSLAERGRRKRYYYGESEDFEESVQCSEREERGTSRRYSTRQASGWADGGEPAIRQVWGMTLAGSRVIGGPPKCDKGHSRGHTRALERRLRARDRRDKSRLRCIVQAPAQARLRGHAGDSLSGRSTLLMLRASTVIRRSSITAR